MNNEMTALIENIKEDYLNWTTQCAGAKGLNALTEINEKMIAEFNEKITFKVGNKYIKVFSARFKMSDTRMRLMKEEIIPKMSKYHQEGGSVWGFVVNTDKDKKFKKGDILKAAGYAAPARNKARGNILDGGYTINWTGPLYL